MKMFIAPNICPAGCEQTFNVIQDIFSHYFYGVPVKQCVFKVAYQVENSPTLPLKEFVLTPPQSKSLFSIQLLLNKNVSYKLSL